MQQVEDAPGFDVQANSAAGRTGPLKARPAKWPG
jgi:hypothetical protein